VTSAPSPSSFRDTLSNALRYWEPRRLVYNGVLVVVVVGCFVANWPDSRLAFSAAEPLLIVFILAVLANVAYCAAYLPDLLLQQSALRDLWIRWRWVLLALGTLFAAALAYLFSQGLFASRILVD